MTKNPVRSDPRESQSILLLDDDLMITEGLAAGLEREGRTVITCNDVEAAELIVEKIHPSHIVADIRLSGPFSCEGLDFIRYVRRHTPESRVILMSGDGSEALQLEASERGAVAFLRKPFDVQELDSILDIISSSELSAGSSECNLIRMPPLDEVLASPSLRPFFQPIVSLRDGRKVIGYESVARYRSESPLRNPELLFRYATRKNRVADLELVCFRATMEAAKQLPETASIFANVHPDVFRSEPKLPERLAALAAANGIATQRIVVEITEQGSLPDGAAVAAVFDALRNSGIRFAFDDVGVAYSHLSQIGKIRPAFLKISQDFGIGFEADSTKRKIVNNIVSLAADFDSQVILEGIEEPSTADAATNLGIDLGQGFFFGRPADAGTFAAREGRA